MVCWLETLCMNLFSTNLCSKFPSWIETRPGWKIYHNYCACQDGFSRWQAYMATFGEWISCAGIVPRCIGWRTLTQHSSPSRTKGQTPKGVAKKSLRAPFVGFTQPSKILKGAWQSAFKGSAAQRIGWRRAPGVRRGLASLRLTYFNAPRGWYLFLTMEDRKVQRWEWGIVSMPRRAGTSF